MSTADQGLRDVLWHAHQLADMTIKGDAPELAEKTAHALISLLGERTVKDSLTVDAQAIESPHPLLRATHYVLSVNALAECPNAAIATIGCVRIVSGVIDDGIYLRVDTESAIAFGGETDASTLNFWLRQSDEIRQEIHQFSGRLKVNDALMKLADFIDRPGSVYCENLVWGRRNSGATGNAIVISAMRRAHLDRPWPPSSDRDLGTLIDLYREVGTQVLPRKGVPHHALDDAMHEARILIAALNLHIARSPE